MIAALANRAYQYQLMGAIFGSEPNHDFVAVITGETPRLSFGFRYESSAEEVDFDKEVSLDFLCNLESDFAKNPTVVVESLKEEYTRLFVGPELSPAPAWESVYRTKDRVLFGPTTLEVRRVYVDNGFLPKGYPNEADDHLALELDFMFNLAQKSLVAWEARDTEETLRLLTAQVDFLNQHLLYWIDDFARDIQKSKTKYFYPQMALVLAHLLKNDVSAIERLSELLDG